MAKLNFQQSLLQSSMPYHPSEILICCFDAQETFIIFNVFLIKNVVLLSIFVETVISFFLSNESLKEMKQQ